MSGTNTNLNIDETLNEKSLKRVKVDEQDKKNYFMVETHKVSTKTKLCHLPNIDLLSKSYSIMSSFTDQQFSVTNNKLFNSRNSNLIAFQQDNNLCFKLISTTNDICCSRKIHFEIIIHEETLTNNVECLRISLSKKNGFMLNYNSLYNKKYKSERNDKCFEKDLENCKSYSYKLEHIYFNYGSSSKKYFEILTITFNDELGEEICKLTIDNCQKRNPFQKEHISFINHNSKSIVKLLV